MSAALKFSTNSLNYLYLKGITIYRVGTHSLRCEEPDSLSLAGYRDIDIQKWEDGEGGF